MYARARFLIAIFGLLSGVACGGGTAAAGPECTAGQTSIPNGKGDPCKQTGTMCSTAGGMGVAICDASTSKWGQCVCMLPQAVGATNPGLIPPASKCGDLTVDPSVGEQCEQGVSSTTCAAMGFGPGATGLVNCVQCKWDMSTCASATATTAGGAGTGAAVGGAGTGM
jgi:hypothetical protein